MFKEFNEFPNLEEEDFDIKSSLEDNNTGSNVQSEEDYSDLMDKKDDDNINGDFYIDVIDDIFEDDNIENTLKTYNYDYNLLIKLLFSLCTDEQVEEALETCGLSQGDYYYPTAETFEILRNYHINGHSKMRWESKVITNVMALFNG